VAFERFQTLLTSNAAPVLADDDELSALMGVRDFPTRVKCATLPWHAFRAALVETEDNQVTTE
jgi:nitrogen fixation NifU-like protein